MTDKTAPAGELSDELLQIHAVVLNYGGDWPEVECDPYTLAHVKRMARDLAQFMRQAGSTEAPQPAPVDEDVSQPWYDIAWRVGATSQNSLAGDELESVQFAASDFEDFCRELIATAPQPAPVRPLAAPEDAMELLTNLSVPKMYPVLLPLLEWINSPQPPAQPAPLMRPENAIKLQAAELIERAAALGIVVTIERRALKPLAMGHAEYRIETRPARVAS